MVCRGLFEGVECFALNVLDDGLLQRERVVGDPDDCRHRLEADSLRRPPPTFAGDELVAVLRFAHEDRLQHANLANRFGEGVQRLLVEELAGLMRVRADRRRRDFEQAQRGRGTRFRRRDQRAESPTQSAGTRHD